MSKRTFGSLIVIFAVCVAAIVQQSGIAASSKSSTSKAPTTEWPQWGGSPVRNNTPEGHNIPTEWNIGKIDYRTGTWDRSTAKNVKWVAKLGSQSYGNPVVGDGKVFMGTNNGAGHLKRFPPDHDLG